MQMPAMRCGTACSLLTHEEAQTACTVHVPYKGAHAVCSQAYTQQPGISYILPISVITAA